VSSGADDKTVRPEREPFLDRWSRRKAEARSEVEAQKPAGKAPAPGAVEQAPAELPPVEKLNFDSDYRSFFHPKVSEETRRAALKKLFGDPRFNVMDGLDVYIDDYSKSDPIPPAMLAGLRQAQKILQWAKGEEKGAPRERARTEDTAAPQLASLELGTPMPELQPAGDERIASTAPAISDPVAGSRGAGNS
jgi:hypothetical protein